MVNNNLRITLYLKRENLLYQLSVEGCSLKTGIA